MMLVNLLGTVLIVAIVWWFWLYKPTRNSKRSEVIIVENGVYKPSKVPIFANKETQLTFLRKDESPCAGMLLFPALEISEELPVNKKKPVTIPPLKSGTYIFGCQMQMYRGELLVNEKTQ